MQISQLKAYLPIIAPYARLARLNQPIGIFLLFLPCCFGLALAQSSSIWLYFLFGVGAVVMRSAGCVINDIIDRNIDAQVERTKNRPLASGEIGLKPAALFALCLLLVGFAILMTLSDTAIFLGLSVVPLVVTYPLMKRITYYPQVFLGITFNYGVLMGYAAATNDVSLAAIIMYVGCIFWTIGYDTIYALQDIADDARVGVKSSAIAFGDNLQMAVLSAYFAFIMCFALAAGYSGLVSSLTILAILLASMALFYQAVSATPKNPKLCLRLFKANAAIGALLAAGLWF